MVLLSIVIATHNRQNYAIEAIRSILDINNNKIQLVVHDTSDSFLLKDLVSNIVDIRFKYHHCTEVLSMTENYNRAVALADGKYITLIGDDDTILNELIDAVEYANANDISVITPKVFAEYYWPDYNTKLSGNYHAGKLRITPFANNKKIVMSDKALTQAFDACFQGTYDLPKLYHGVAKKELLDIIKSNTGDYFHGVSPDISIAISLAYYSDNYLVVEYPLTLPGSSGNSNSGRSAMRTHVGRLEDDPHMKRFKSYIWNNTLPRFFSVETVWAQAGIETINKIPNSNNKFNYLKFYSLCLVNHPSYYREVFSALKCYKNESGLSSMAILFPVFKYIMYLGYKKIHSLTYKVYSRFVGNKVKSNQMVEFTALNVFDAKKIADDYLCKLNKCLFKK
ncbi:glycosyltransferase [Limnobaculum zhutongyuii]|uniref:Glycosyltransferase n=1 Tax=Limnobaculum zhutongyuii TaxID=2498113 RepID=A0A411WP37_9GAMM|nr:glycosyltransferase [Limnobaculum zhutongyuii]QBH97938.1 glycosyltransferase [Limnobaculum zhutongyuii]TQS88203.1 glycosyltransferase [Limnobaculum zhutongyuii]